MKTSKPFTLILHVINKNQLVTDLTIQGMAFHEVSEEKRIEQFSYSISGIVLDAEESGNIASVIDLQQINNACFKFAQSVFNEPLPSVEPFPGFTAPVAGNVSLAN